MIPNLGLLIENYICAYPHEKAPYDMLSFYKTERAVFSKRNKKGHFTGSGWIVSPDKRKILMTHHKIINKSLNDNKLLEQNLQLSYNTAKVNFKGAYEQFLSEKRNI